MLRPGHSTYLGNFFHKQIHAAGVISDGTLLQQNMSKFETVYNGKVNGAWPL